MKLKALSIVAVSALGIGGAAYAQGESQDVLGDLDVTMKLLLPEEAQRPDSVTRELELPLDVEAPRPSEQGVEHGSAGLDNADQATENGRSFGQETAAAAQENRENLGRGSRPDGPPGPPSDLPGPPDNPGSPNAPEVPGGPPEAPPSAPGGGPPDVPGPPTSPPGGQ